MIDESRKVQKVITERMQERLEARGNKVLGRLLAPRLRRRYTTALRFVADSDIVEKLDVMFAVHGR